MAFIWYRQADLAEQSNCYKWLLQHLLIDIELDAPRYHFLKQQRKRASMLCTMHN